MKNEIITLEIDYDTAIHLSNYLKEIYKLEHGGTKTRECIYCKNLIYKLSPLIRSAAFSKKLQRNKISYALKTLDEYRKRSLK